VIQEYGFEMLRAEIGSSVLLDTIDLSDPYLVSIGDGPVIVEGALIQSHEVRNGVLNFYPIRVGQKSSVGPYAVTQKLNQAGDRVEVSAQFFGIYMVAFLSPLSAAIIYFIYHWLSQISCSVQSFSVFRISGAFYWLPFTIFACVTMPNTTPTSAVNFATSVDLKTLHGTPAACVT
ncbi:hypothetical protein U1Q18_003186, partial [Sarracenia purpurea var. burkii]